MKFIFLVVHYLLLIYLMYVLHKLYFYISQLSLIYHNQLEIQNKN